jgi:hypothetical protein
MLKYCFFFISFFLMSSIGSAQELKCVIAINSEQVSGTNRQVFKTLELALNEFVNKQKWTSKTYKQEERVECAMTLIITSRTSNSFLGTLQVNAVRPVYESSYKTPIFNFKDKDISFEYTEYDPLIFNPNMFESNLISLLSFYAYTILGIDAATFAPQGGEAYFNRALDIANLAQQSNYEGWAERRNQQNRYALIDQILAVQHKEYREVLYDYHRSGFDSYASDAKKSKLAIREALLKFEKLFRRNQNSFVVRTFFDAKADEIAAVFSDGPEVDTENLFNLLSRISPVNSTKWEKFN